MLKKQLVILNKYGLHVRPSTAFSQAAQRFQSEITVETEDGRIADGKSLLDLLGLGLVAGSPITIRIDGPDEQEAMDTLSRMVADQFGLRYEE